MPLDIDVMENEVIREWIEQGMAKGMQQGMQQGVQQGRRQGEAAILRKLISAKFASLPKPVDERIDLATSEELERWSLRLLEAGSIGQIFE